MLCCLHEQWDRFPEFRQYLKTSARSGYNRHRGDKIVQINLHFFNSLFLKEITTEDKFSKWLDRLRMMAVHWFIAWNIIHQINFHEKPFDMLETNFAF
jgi:creatinine amidohydrolase/Fe(II)-dependent formamide hydrolase-like protein